MATIILDLPRFSSKLSPPIFSKSITQYKSPLKHVKINSRCTKTICSSFDEHKDTNDINLRIRICTSLISSTMAASILFGGNAIAASPLIEDAASKAKEVQESIGRLTTPSKSGSGLNAPGLDQSAFLANKSPDESDEARKSREFVAKSQLGDEIKPELFGSEEGRRRDQNVYGTSDVSSGDTENLFSFRPSPGEPGSQTLKSGIDKGDKVGSADFSSNEGESYQNIFEPLQESLKEGYGKIVNGPSVGSISSQPSGSNKFENSGRTPSLGKDILGRAREKAQTEGAEDYGGGKKDFRGQGRSDFDEGGAIFSSIQNILKSEPKKDEKSLVGESPNQNPSQKNQNPFNMGRDILGRARNNLKSGLDDFASKATGISGVF